MALNKYIQTYKGTKNNTTGSVLNTTMLLLNEIYDNNLNKDVTKTVEYYGLDSQDPIDAEERWIPLASQFWINSLFYNKEQIDQKIESIDQNIETINTNITNNYYSKEDVDKKLTRIYRHQGSVENYESLPTVGLTSGDVYDTKDTGMNYVYIEEEGVFYGYTNGTVTLYTKEEIVKSDTCTVFEIKDGILTKLEDGVNAALLADGRVAFSLSSGLTITYPAGSTQGITKYWDALGTSVATVGITGDYNDLKNKPEIPELIQSDWETTDDTDLSYIKNKPNIIEPIQSDWNQSDSASLDYIKNKPNIVTSLQDNTSYVRYEHYTHPSTNLQLNLNNDFYLMSLNNRDGSNPLYQIVIDTSCFNNLSINSNYHYSVKKVLIYPSQSQTAPCRINITLNNGTDNRQSAFEITQRGNIGTKQISLTAASCVLITITYISYSTMVGATHQFVEYKTLYNQTMFNNEGDINN